MDFKIILFYLAALAPAAFAKEKESQFDEFGLTRLHHAILDNKASAIDKILAGDDSDQLADLPDNVTKSTPLHLLVEKVATQSGEAQTKTIEQIQTLVDMKARRDLQNDSGWTALNKAVYLASDLVDYPLEVVEILLKDCVAVNVATRGQTALHFAANSRLQNARSKDLVELLMKKCSSSIDFNASDKMGWSAMKVALASDNMDTVALLKPKTSSLSFTARMVLLGLGLILLVIGIGAAYYIYKRKMADKINAVEPIDSPKSVSSKANGTDDGAGVTEAVSESSKEKYN